MRVERKVFEKLGRWNYGVYAVMSLDAGANYLSENALGMRGANIISMSHFGNATISTDATSLDRLPLPASGHDGKSGSDIRIDCDSAGNSVIIEVMGW